MLIINDFKLVSVRVNEFETMARIVKSDTAVVKRCDVQSIVFRVTDTEK